MTDTFMDETQLRESTKERAVRTQSFEIDLTSLVARIEKGIIKLGNCNKISPFVQERQTSPIPDLSQLFNDI
jgi:hypothetical protein